MSKSQKLLERFLSKPADFTWDELRTLLAFFNFSEVTQKGGSYRSFMDPKGRKIMLHKPHPENTLKRYALKDVKEKLEDFGLI